MLRKISLNEYVWCVENIRVEEINKYVKKREETLVWWYPNKDNDASTFNAGSSWGGVLVKVFM